MTSVNGHTEITYNPKMEDINNCTHHALLNNTNCNCDEQNKKSNKELFTESVPAVNDIRCCPQRWIFACIGVWFGITYNLFCVNMSIAVVCMVQPGYNTKSSFSHHGNRTHSNINNVTTSYDTVVYIDDNDINITSFKNNTVKHVVDTETIGEFSWPKTTQSFILSGYFYGYLLAQIPGGWLGSMFGCRRIIGSCMSLATVLTLLIPVLARTSVYLIVVARCLLGVLGGLSLTNVCGLVGVWALPTERSRMTGLLWFGQTMGAILAHSTSGMLCVHGFDDGWASIFYIHGISGLIFIVCWWIFVYDNPETHPRISEAERNLIISSNGIQILPNKRPSIPWKKILTYPPLYVTYTAHICDNWTYYLLITSLPQYLHDCLHFDIQSNGFLACLPYITFLIGVIMAGSIADFIRAKNVLSITTIRKLFFTTGCIGIAVFIVIPGYLSHDQWAFAVICLSLCTLLQSSGITGGYAVNSVDIAPRYASIIFGISNTLATIPGAIVPLIVASLTKHQTVEEWRVVFYISAGVSTFACVIYGLFANNELAPWSDSNTDVEIQVKPPRSSCDNDVDKKLMDAPSVT
ncbi:hypothetical protein ACF0H5_016680 [Mactra antiquata]